LLRVESGAGVPITLQGSPLIAQQQVAQPSHTATATLYRLNVFSFFSDALVYGQDIEDIAVDQPDVVRSIRPGGCSRGAGGT
jgi:hypothetical protein